MYDTLLEIKEEKQYTKIEGRTYGIGNFSEAIAGLLGGLLGNIIPFTSNTNSNCYFIFMYPNGC